MQEPHDDSGDKWRGFNISLTEVVHLAPITYRVDFIPKASTQVRGFNQPAPKVPDDAYVLVEIANKGEGECVRITKYRPPEKSYPELTDADFKDKAFLLANTTYQSRG